MREIRGPATCGARIQRRSDMPDKEELYDQAVDAYADDKFDEAIE